MKIQLITAATLLALSSSAFAEGYSYGAPPTVTNNATNSLAIGGETLIAEGAQDYYGAAAALGYNNGGRAIAGSIYFEGNACSCDFGDISNTSHNAIAVGSATAGSIHVNTVSKYSY